jgi:hypothetical protein
VFFTHTFLMTALAAGSRGDSPMIITILVGMLLLAGLVALFVHLGEKKRTEKLEALARNIGLPFFPGGDDSLKSSLDHFHLFSQGRSRKIRNMLHGENSEVELAIFDYRYRTSGGKNSHTHQQSVIYFRSPVLSLPHFAMRPENLFHKIGGAMGYQDIDFESHPRFSADYLLRGDDEQAVREFFTDELLTFIESQESICVEGGGDQLVFYRQRKRIKPDEVNGFMEEGFKAFDVFRGPDIS